MPSPTPTILARFVAFTVMLSVQLLPIIFSLEDENNHLEAELELLRSSVQDVRDEATRALPSDRWEYEVSIPFIPSLRLGRTNGSQLSKLRAEVNPLSYAHNMLSRREKLLFVVPFALIIVYGLPKLRERFMLAKRADQLRKILAYNEEVLKEIRDIYLVRQKVVAEFLHIFGLESEYEAHYLMKQHDASLDGT
ncbi:hypothetical protein BD410DRAFT_805255 [Rickenella mellea]|uniref:Uncharacterized protein n=1 Tax=Rickenella mellea TaxID=50990 RepID=A0A4Y7PXW7_9AGAM|nr:hypothetical protein BD410DRAFT_805255 [Rickenella mellea]